MTSQRIHFYYVVQNRNTSEWTAGVTSNLGGMHTRYPDKDFFHVRLTEVFEPVRKYINRAIDILPVQKVGDELFMEELLIPTAEMEQWLIERRDEKIRLDERDKREEAERERSRNVAELVAYQKGGLSRFWVQHKTKIGNGFSSIGCLAFLIFPFWGLFLVLFGNHGIYVAAGIIIAIGLLITIENSKTDKHRVNQIKKQLRNRAR